MSLRAAVVPAAGLGSRLWPLALAVPKELLPLGAAPALCAPLLEADAAGIRDVAIVTAPGKEAIGRLLDPSRWPLGAVGDPPALGPLRALLGRLRLRYAEQPQPVGAVDAIERGRRCLGLGDDEPYAVLYPDLVHLPDQQALGLLRAAHERTGAAVIGLYQAPQALPHGPSAQVILARAPGRLPTGEPLPVARVSAPPRGAGAAPGELRTTFAVIHRGPLRCPGEGDAGYLPLLNALAEAGQLHGVLLPGEVGDIGTMEGYQQVARRFAAGEARLRGF